MLLTYDPCLSCMFLHRHHLQPHPPTPPTPPSQIEAMGVKHMKSAVKDPDMQRQLTPDYSVGCKRILASDEYYPALAADNVTLVASGLKQVCCRSLI